MKFEKARRQFTFLAVSTFVIGLLASMIGLLVLDPLLKLMGCTESMFFHSHRYASILLLFLPIYMLQMYFQSVFVTAARPGTGFAVTLAGGLTNMVFDYVFIGVLGWQDAGAAFATGIGQLVAAALGIFCFIRHPKREIETALYYMPFSFSRNDLLKAMSNGMSEFFSHSASSILSILYNVQLMRYIGEEGVAAFGTIMYLSMIFMAVSIGYTMGVSPLISCQYGAGNREELHSLTTKSIAIIVISSIVMLLLAEGMGEPLSALFAGYDPYLYSITLNAFRICSLVYLFSGMAIFGSGFFTALNNGPVSAAISLIRTLAFQVGFILIFPALWGVDGIWFSMSAAEAMAAAVSVVFLIVYSKRFGYFYRSRQAAAI